MGHFRSDLRDLEFDLFEVFRVQDGPTTADVDTDPDTLRGVLRELNALATGPLAQGFAEADRHPPTFDPATHAVTVPDAVKSAFHLLIDGEWWRFGLPAALGGIGVPASVQWAATELILGANPAVHLYLGGPRFAAIVHRLGTPEQQRWAEVMIERGWGATMVLTEPDAGSDVGAGRTRAVAQPDGTWHLDGVKRFITSAEHDLTENIVHLVLARPEAPGFASRPGTKGLSLFLVPKFRFDPTTGDPNERNGVFATALEHKMGLRASATCELAFGQHGVPAVGYLLGDRHDGIAQMFEVIEYARMMVGTKAIGTLSTGYRTALAYARERVQGPDLVRVDDKTAPRVTIIHHADVRRMLMLQKAYAEGLRMLYLYAATQQDVVRAGGPAAARAAAVNDLLLPLVKGVGSERASEMLMLALQTLGGSGYLQDYPVEQYLRDAKIDSLYEGTTAIQSLDLLLRKIVKDRGRAFGYVVDEIAAFLADEGGNGRLKEERALLGSALDDVRAMVAALTGHVGAAAREPARVHRAGQHSVRLLMALGELLVGWLLLRRAQVALETLDGAAPSRDRAFYQGKVAVARFFAATRLPLLSAERTIVEHADDTLMELAEDGF
ncbi:MAG: acyl-CoA dehydrogenase protein [Pseudonocardia sp.]|nr:acyl-CoA dehydrogenase protein [Pseudonocardia sp.]